MSPGYLGRPDLSAAAFDEEGYYRTGDAGRLVEENAPDAGLRFDGRIAEDFKLLTGTWVSVGTLRPALLDAAGGLLHDAVIAGHGRGCVAALCWLREGSPHDPRIRDRLAAAPDRHNRAATGSARRIERLLVMAEPPSLPAGETTDKGYVNQRAVLERRAGLVELLYAEPPPEAVIRGRHPERPPGR